MVSSGKPKRTVVNTERWLCSIITCVSLDDVVLLPAISIRLLVNYVHCTCTNMSSEVDLTKETLCEHPEDSSKVVPAEPGCVLPDAL